MSSKQNLHDQPPSTTKPVSQTPLHNSDSGIKSPPKPSLKHASIVDHPPRVREDDPTGTKPDFIYGGPFINVEKICPFMNITTPVNVALQGTFKKSFAYFSLRERMPVILTKVIDYLSREGSKSNDDENKQMIQRINKLKSDLITNKPYDPFTYKSEETDMWNEWLNNLDHKKYFMNSWLWTECYVYRKLREFSELSDNLKNFDPFEEQKQMAFTTGLEWMCIVAEKFVDMLPESERDKKKADWITLLKLCLWANRCDLSLTLGDPASIKGLPEKPGDKIPPPPPPPPKKKKNKPSAAAAKPKGPFYDMIDPFQMIIDLKEKVLSDDSGRSFEQIMKRSNLLRGKIEAGTTAKVKCSCHRLAKVAKMEKKEAPPAPPPPPPALSTSPSGAALAVPEAAEPVAEAPKPPCPAKVVLASQLYFDIVLDNVGYELFCDLCFAHFLIAQNIAQTVRFHVKKYPWFVSDVTTEDFHKMIQKCRNATYNREVKPEWPKPVEGEAVPPPPPPPAEGEAPPEEEVSPIKYIQSESLQQLGQQWAEMVENGTFMICSEDYWTYPHVYKDMKMYDYWMYRRLQLSVGILFKGDLNYRKLLADRNTHPYIKFIPSLQGFTPAPILAVRTVKSEVICGLRVLKGKKLNKAGGLNKYEQLMSIDEKWMEKGEFGQIQFSNKVEKMKTADRPCPDYGEKCFGVVCPVHPEL